LFTLEPAYFIVLSFGYFGFYTPAVPTGLFRGGLAVFTFSSAFVGVFFSALGLSVLGVDILTYCSSFAGSSSFDFGDSFFLSISTSSIP